jgi:uncharacterized protein (TIGR02186 family)
LSDHLVAITTGFVGVDVLLFGAIPPPAEGAGEGTTGGTTGGTPGGTRGGTTGGAATRDVVVVVRGPEDRQVLHRKSNVAGIWMNTARMTFGSVPSYYAVAATRPLADIAAPTVLAANGIGLEHLDFEIPAARVGGQLREEWREGLIRAKQRQNLYVQEAGTVRVVGDTLFRTEVHFPTNVPTGLYQAQVYLFSDGQIVSAQAIPLSVSKVGLEAEIFDFAHQQAGAYGLIAVLLALVAGWLGHLIFRRD